MYNADRAADRLLEVMSNLESMSTAEITLELSKIVNVLKRGVSGERHVAIQSYVAQVHQWAVEKGWWERERDLLHQVALHHTELSEVVEEFRKHGDLEVHYEGEKPCGVPSEFADVLVRIFDTCGYYKIDLGDILEKKIAYNDTRAIRHGGKHA